MANNYSISVAFEVLNKATGPLASIGAGFQNLSNTLRNSEVSIRSIGQSLDSAGKKMEGVGRSLSARLTVPFAAFAATSLMAWNQNEKAEEQVRAGLASTHGVVRKTFEQLTALANELQEKTLFGDNEILGGATAQLLTFTNIAGEQFDRTQKAILDVATRLATTRGGAADLTGTAIQLGKALNDPTTSLSALTRSGIQFTQVQKNMIDMLWKTGRQAEAQDLILTELEHQYGGSAEAAARAGTGGLKILANQIDKLREDFGKLFYEIIGPLVPGFMRFVKAAREFVALHPGIVKIFLALAAVAATVGPLILMIGGIVSLAGTFAMGWGAVVTVLGFAASAVSTLSWVFSAFTIAGGPVLWIIGAVALAAFLLIKYWEPIKLFFINLWDYISGVFQRNKTAIMILLTPLIVLFAPIVAGIWLTIKGVQYLISYIDSLGIEWGQVWINMRTGIESVLGPLDRLIEGLKIAKEILLPTNYGTLAASGSYGAGGFNQGYLNLMEKTMGFLNGSREGNRSEILVKVQSEEGTTATIGGVKTTKGKANVNISNSTNLGLNFFSI